MKEYLFNYEKTDGNWAKISVLARNIKEAKESLRMRNITIYDRVII